MRTDRKLEFGFVFAFLILAFGIGSFLSQVETKVGIENFVQNYVMPRPKSLFSSLFSLDQREVVREYKNPFKTKEAETKALADAQKKNAEVKAEQKKAAKKSAKKSADKEKKFEVEVVEASPQKGLSGDSDLLNTGSGAGFIAAVRNPQSPVAEEALPDANDNEKADQGEKWRALLLSQPTEENMNALLGAYAAGEVSARSFYLIISDLISFPRTESAELALIGLQATPSVSSFNALVRFERQFQNLVADKYAMVLREYTQLNRLSILAGAMTSRDTRLVKRAIELSMVAYSQNGGSAGNGNQFVQVRPALQQLTISTDTEIAELATTALAQFQLVAASKVWTNQ